MMDPRLLIVVVFLLFFISHSPYYSIASAAAVLETKFPLSTNGRWIVNPDGHRVKLACANWPAHVDVVAPEGLQHQPLDAISKNVVSMGFNCIRLTWPTYLATNTTGLASLTFRNSLLNLGLNDSVAGVTANNAKLLDLPLIEVLQAVVSNLASNNIMVVLDNHLSKPMWCCGNTDGNGFFGDEFFNPDEWLQGLKMMASIFNNQSNVVGMSLRNELRGKKQNNGDWYSYMQQGAEAVHATNPNVLVILSGLNYDLDLSFLEQKKAEVSFTGKVVYEMHWYGFSDGGDWQHGDPNEVCRKVVDDIKKRGTFLLDQGWPLFFSEYGIDILSNDDASKNFMNCFVNTAKTLDFDWAIWGLQGSYYFREGQANVEEYYGVLNADWSQPKNTSFMQLIAPIQSPSQGPGISQ